MALPSGIPLSYLATNSLGQQFPSWVYIPEKSPHRPEGGMLVLRVAVWVRAGWLLLQEGGWLKWRLGSKEKQTTCARGSRMDIKTQ